MSLSRSGAKAFLLDPRAVSPAMSSVRVRRHPERSAPHPASLLIDSTLLPMSGTPTHIWGDTGWQGPQIFSLWGSVLQTGDGWQRTSFRTAKAAESLIRGRGSLSANGGHQVSDQGQNPACLASWTPVQTGGPRFGLTFSPHLMFGFVFQEMKEAPNVSALKFLHAMVSSEHYVSLILVLSSLFLQP